MRTIEPIDFTDLSIGGQNIVEARLLGQGRTISLFIYLALGSAIVAVVIYYNRQLRQKDEEIARLRNKAYSNPG